MKTIYKTFSKSPYKLFYNAFVPRKIRKQWQYRYHELPLQNKMADFWQGKIEQLNQSEHSSEHSLENCLQEIQFPQTHLVGRKIIWQFWSQGFDSLPNNIKACVQSVKDNAGDYEVIYLDEKNYQDYVSFPKYIEENRQTSIPKTAHFSDLLRTALLYHYGGVWLDASVFMTGNIPKTLAESPLFLYQRDANSPQKNWGRYDQHFYFNWRDDFKIKHLNCILLAQPNNKAIKQVLMLLMDFWQQQPYVPHYFFYQILLAVLAHTHKDFTSMPIMDDTLPHLLQSKLNQAFNQSEFQSICQGSVFHKIGTRHHYRHKTIMGKQTFYGRLFSFVE